MTTLLGCELFVLTVKTMLTFCTPRIYYQAYINTGNCYRVVHITGEFRVAERLRLARTWIVHGTPQDVTPLVIDAN